MKKSLQCYQKKTSNEKWRSYDFVHLIDKLKLMCLQCGYLNSQLEHSCFDSINPDLIIDDIGKESKSA